MSLENKNSTYMAMYRRWIYMLIAILSAALLPVKPVFSFQDDKGIIYVRSFSMDQTEVIVTQTEIATGVQTITDTMSVKGLYICYKTMLWCCILCFLCFFSKRWRMRIAVITAFVAGAYYILMAYYAIRLTDIHFATLSPTFTAILPAIVLQMMLLIRRNIIDSMVYLDDNSGI